LAPPVLPSLSLCTCCRHYPRAAAGRIPSLIHPAVSAFPERVTGSACASAFSRLARRSLALRPAHSRRHQFVTRYTEGFSYFVASIAAPVASGWSVRRVGLAPTGKRRLSTAHTRSGLMHRGKQPRSFDHLVGAGGEPGRHVETKRFGGFEVDREFEFGGLIDRQVGGQGTVENASHVDS